MRPTNFATHLTAFLTSYLPAQRNVSPNTIRAYRDAFVLLLRYCRDVRRLAPDRLSLEQIDPSLVLDFLDHLEKERRCAPRTRNLRLTAVHAFFRYLQTEEPGLLLRCQRILAIPLQRCAPPAVEYLSPESLAAILHQPDLGQRGAARCHPPEPPLRYGSTGARADRPVGARCAPWRAPPKSASPEKGERRAWCR